eukprot:g4196.t1
MTALPDDMVASDLTSAIVLAGVRHEETIAAFDDGPKRRSRWSECKVAKKGKRWGLPDDKPYKPLSYVDLPMGLSEKEIDQFLREQRLEDLHRKIQAHELEDVDPDIRPCTLAGLCFEMILQELAFAFSSSFFVLTSRPGGKPVRLS